jgi:hypothetical protein
MIALNAQPIIDARMRGFKPDDLVLVSLVGHVHAKNHTVRAIPGVTYDWRWVRGLELCVWNCAEQWGAQVYLIPTANDLARPRLQWSHELDFLPWLDFQNDDFLECRTYSRTPEGMPHAVSS